MAAPSTVEPASPRTRAQLFALLPQWQQALLVYAATRVFTLATFALVARAQGPNPWTGAVPPSLVQFLNFWDAGWYQRIVTEGYPRQLPLGESGDTLQNAWAFYPMHALAAADVSRLTGLDFGAGAVLVSVTAGAVGAIVILALFRTFLSPGRAVFGLALVLLYPASAVLVTGYAESLGLVLLAFSLYLVRERRYLWAIPVVALMDLTRPVGVAFSFFMLGHLIHRLLSREKEPYPRREILASWILGVLSCAFALLHPAIAAWRTGVLTAYTDTEAAWHTGETRFVVQWFVQAESLLGPAGWFVLLAVLAGFAWALSRPGRRLGADLQIWCGAYAVYLLIFFTPQTSTARLLIPLFPMLALLALPRRASWRLVLLVLFAALQVWWILAYWVLGGIGVVGPP